MRMILEFISTVKGARSGVVDCGTMLQAGKSRVRFPTRYFFSTCLFLSAAQGPGATKPVIELSTRNHPGVG
jgi:hypothetical protein